MITLTLGRIAEIVGGRVEGDPETQVTGGVEFDSRTVGPGDLFVAIGGARVDGHDFAERAIEQGAAGVLAFRSVGVPAVIVPPVSEAERGGNSYATEHDADGSTAAVLKALGALAGFVVRELEAGSLKVIGVTGSAGKTSTKDMMAAIFRAAGPTVAPVGSFNNEIGHPYTALKCDESTRYLVAEMSARGIGHVANLARISPPHVGVVLNVGTAHLGEFGSREVIAQAKGELVEALPADGVAVLNADDPFVAAMATRTKAKVVYTSAAGAPADLRADNVLLDDQARASFDLILRDEARPHRVQLAVSGEHQVSNALQAIAAGLAAGLELDVILPALEGFRGASAHRMDVRLRADGLMVIDDSYNANPDSMRAGLKALKVGVDKRGGRAVAVLGPMSELGADAVSVHAELGRSLPDFGVAALVAVGESADAEALARSAAEAGVAVRTARDATTAADIAADLLQPGDAVLVKASNSFRLWEVAEKLVPESGK